MTTITREARSERLLRCAVDAEWTLKESGLTPITGNGRGHLIARGGAAFALFSLLLGIAAGDIEQQRSHSSI